MSPHDILPSFFPSKTYALLTTSSIVGGTVSDLFCFDRILRFVCMAVYISGLFHFGILPH